MENTIKLIKKFFKSNNWKYESEVLNEHTIFRFGVDTEIVIGNLDMLICVVESDYIVLAVLNNKAEKDKLPAVSEYLHRANYGLKNGNFELDYSDGEIRYKSYVNFRNSILSDKIITESIMMPIAMFTKYGNNLLETMVTGVVAEVQ